MDIDILYENTDIGNMVQVRGCIVRDTCWKRCDSLELEFENADGWYRWGPKEDDRVSVSYNGYRSGEMYVTLIRPEEGKYRVYASSLPCRARTRGSKSFVKETLGSIVQICANDVGMGSQLYGVESGVLIPYAERRMESGAAFLSRLLEQESAVLKCLDGKYTAIGIPYAQGLEPVKTIDLSAQQEKAQYSRSGTAWKSVTVKGPYADATARDSSVTGTQHMDVTAQDLPAMDAPQAGRWARGRLLAHNLTCETVNLSTTFDPGATAMVGFELTGSTDMNGNWLAYEVEHDLVNRITKMVLHRCIGTIQ